MRRFAGLYQGYAGVCRMQISYRRVFSVEVQPDGQRARGILAGFTHKGELYSLLGSAVYVNVYPYPLPPLLPHILLSELAVTYDEAFDILGDVPVGDIHDFEEELRNERHQKVVFSTRHVSVLDTFSSDDGNGKAQLRSLHFNHRLTFVQSCVGLTNGEPSHAMPPPIHGLTGTHLQGLGISVGLHRLLQETNNGDVEPQDPGSTKPIHVCVLGGGGCTLPAFLHFALPHAKITVVEQSADVCAAARECFGIAALEAAEHGRFALKEVVPFAHWFVVIAIAFSFLIVDFLPISDSMLSRRDVPLSGSKIHPQPNATSLL
jgi:hypothetical protein